MVERISYSGDVFLKGLGIDTRSESVRRLGLIKEYHTTVRDGTQRTVQYQQPSVLLAVS